MTGPIWAPQARLDLAWQTDFIAALDLKAAERIGERIERRAAWLADHPSAGARLGRGRARSFRVRGTPYTVLCRPSFDTALILRIVHTRQNWR